MTNNCLRAACLSDMVDSWLMIRRYQPWPDKENWLAKLYDAEWRKRGYERSP